MTATTKTISLVLIGSALVFAAWRYVKPAEDDKDAAPHSTTGGYHGGGSGGHAWFWPTSSGSHGGGPSSGQHGGASARGGFGSTGSGVGA